MKPLFKIFQRTPQNNDRFFGLELGDLAQDTLTGFAGVIVSKNSNISGCDQLALQPVCESNKFEDCRWFDIERVSLIEARKVQMTTRQTGLDAVPPSRTPKRA